MKNLTAKSRRLINLTTLNLCTFNFSKKKCNKDTLKTIDRAEYFRQVK